MVGYYAALHCHTKDAMKYKHSVWKPHDLTCDFNTQMLPSQGAMLSPLTRFSQQSYWGFLITTFSPSLSLSSTWVDSYVFRFCYSPAAYRQQSAEKGAFHLYLQHRWSRKHPSHAVHAYTIHVVCLCFLVALFNIPVVWCVDVGGGRQGEGGVMATDFSTSTWIRLQWYFLFVHTDTLRLMYSHCVCWVCTAKGPKVMSVKLDVCGIFLQWIKNRHVTNLSHTPSRYVGWRFLTLNVLPPPDPAPRRRCSHPRTEGHRGAEAFPRPFGGLLQATAGEGGETVWGKVPGKSFLPACDLSAAWKVLCSSVWSFSAGANGICSHFYYSFWWIQKSVCSAMLVVWTFIPTYIFLLFSQTQLLYSYL